MSYPRGLLNTRKHMKKRCPKCCKLKSIKEFYKNRTRKDNLSCHCKECYRVYQQSANGKTVQVKANKKYRQTYKTEIIKRQKKHYHTIEGYLQSIFRDMNYRCNNSNCKAYKNYGAKGVQVKFKSFNEFFIYVTVDLGFNTYEKIKGLDIHRTKKHYEKGNIEFLTRAEHQMRHKQMRKRKKVK